MTDKIVAKRRQLLDAIYAIHTDGGIRVDGRLAADVEQGWNEYDEALTDALRAENERLVSLMEPQHRTIMQLITRLAESEAKNGRSATNLTAAVDQSETFRLENIRLRAEIERLREECRLAAELQVRTGQEADAEIARLRAVVARLRAVVDAAFAYNATPIDDPESGARFRALAAALNRLANHKRA